MIGRRAVLGLSLLSALLLCAFAAQSASAQKAENTTAFTCVKDGNKKGEFEDAHCDKKHPKTEGEYTHKEIAKDVTTEIEVTNEKMGAATNEKTSQVLKATVFAVKTEITCDTVKSRKTAGVDKNFIHNVESGAGKHTVTGEGTVEYTGCKALKPAKCTVKEPIIVKGTFQGVEKTGPEKNTMGIEFTPEKDKEGKALAFTEITLEGAECALKGKPFKVDGTAIATANPTVGDTAKHSGATATFTEAMTKETLKIGLNPAEHKGGFTVKMAKVEGVDQNPIVLTTTT